MTHSPGDKPPFWRDDRFWRIALQVLAIIAVVTIFAILGSNLSSNMQRSGVKFGFDFLQRNASFAIGESVIPYDPATDSYLQVLLAGLVNTLRVAISGIILTTFVGILAGIAQFSDNWLLNRISLVYVEIVRNTPLLLQLLFWYGLLIQLPSVENRINLFDSIFLSKRGIYLPWMSFPQAWGWFAVLFVGAIAAILLWRWRTKIMVEQGASGKPQLIALASMAVAAVLIITIGLGWQVPQVAENGSFVGGLRLSVEFSALLTGLVFYTGGFIAEIVRAGIQSVSQGQWEAANSLGLKSGLVMRLVIFPQALRVMIPPLNSQYQNLVKNSSLAIAVAYPDIYSVANTTFNQTGRVVEVILIIMFTYLFFNLLISSGMNLLNRTVQLRER